MNRSCLLWTLLASLLGLLTPSAVRADIPSPPRDLPPGKTQVPLTVKVDPNKDVSFLRISRQIAGKLATPEPNKKSDWSPSAPRSIIAALAMSVGIAGAFFVRGRRRLGLAALALVAGSFVLTTAVQTFGNAAPMPPNPPNAAGLALPDALPADFKGGVVIEISDDKRFFGVELIIGTRPTPQRRPGGPQVAPPKQT